MSDTQDDTATAKPHPPRRTTARRGAASVGLSALAIFVGSRLTWVSVEGFDDKQGAVHHALTGGAWATEITAVALVLVAAAVGGVVLRRVGRRVIGVLAAVTAAAVALLPLGLLTRGADPERVRGLLTSGATSQRADDPVALSTWAQITGVDVHATGPAVALAGAALALVGGVLLAVWPGTDPARRTRFARGGQRRRRIGRDLEAEPESGRVLWDALDADIDPTDR